MIGSVTKGLGVIRVLDVGCGDGFICRELSRRSDVQVVDGVDVNLTEQEVDALRRKDDKVYYYNAYRDLDLGRYNLVLLMDVLEHVQEDNKFLAEIVDGYLAKGGNLIITVPAFSFLYSRHDVYLAHFRRYDRKQLVRLVKDSNLICIRSGYLFLSLLPIRLAEVLWERITDGERERSRGVGGWSSGKLLTLAATAILRCENRLSMFLNSIGVRIPGLTVWAVCRKRA
ncbi:class I SAM-dependent methyltransferase [bacterium]|nr:class I SAM-dependent methyltransferase [bacterium]